jgi:hypothetical protein
MKLHYKDKHSTNFEKNKYLMLELYARARKLNCNLDMSIQRLTRNNLKQLLETMDKLETGNMFLDHDKEYRFHYSKD